MTNPINPIDTAVYFKEPTTEISKDYDFNGDGTVDIADYNIALVKISDDDPETTVDFTKEHLDNVFAALISEDNKLQTYDEITEENVSQVAQTVIAAIQSNELTPANAKTLKQLQFIGRDLTKYIKECATIAEIYAKQLPIQKAALDEIEAKRAEKEEAYAKKEAEVEAKSRELAVAVDMILQASNKMTQKRKEESEAIVKECVNDYTRGKYPNKTLADVIASRLANTGGFNVSDLQSAIQKSKSIQTTLGSLCSDIDSLVGDIRTYEKEYTQKNAIYNSTLKSRNSIISAAQLASTKYQSGYQKRLDLREDLIKAYHVDATGSDRASSSNAQVLALGEFLNNKELDNMTFSDALAIIPKAFDGCGITLSKAADGTVSMSVPKGHDSTASNIYAAFIQSMKDNFGVEGEVEDDGYQDPGDEDGETPTMGTVARTDPISFVNGNVKYEFIEDKNNDGIFNDKNEFLGAENGWKEMAAYDTNGDGHINGKELDKLQLVGVDQVNGQFTFATAAEAGIKNINLASYKETEGDKMQVNGDILDGTYSLDMTNGETITGQQSYDMNINLQNKFATLYGASIEDTNASMYKENPFLEEFEETVNTDNVVDETKRTVKDAHSDSDRILENGEAVVKTITNRGVQEGTKLKNKLDEQEAIETKKQEKAEAKKEEEKELEAKKAEEKKNI